MKKFLVMLMVVAMASFLFVGCLPGTTTPVTEEEEEEEVVVVPTTVAPIIIAVTDGAYVNKVEAADGIIVNGTAPTYSEVKIYINDICAGTGDTLADGTWTVVVAKADLGADGDKVLYATAKEGALDVSAKSNEKKFTLDTVPPKISAVKARGGIAFAIATAVEVCPFGPGTSALDGAIPSPFVTVATSADVVTGTWTVNVNTGFPFINNVTITDPTGETYTYSCAGSDTFAENAPIPGVQFILTPVLAAGQVSQIVCTAQVAAVPGRASLTFDEDVSWTQATTGNYTIFNTALGYDILTGAPFFLPFTGNTIFMAYNETTDTMFWTEPAGLEGVDLTQGQWLTFQVDSVADVAGNAIPVTAPETANTVVLASTIVIAP